MALSYSRRLPVDAPLFPRRIREFLRSPHLAAIGGAAIMLVALAGALAGVIVFAGD
jgi:hypothetical protein